MEDLILNGKREIEILNGRRVTVIVPGKKMSCEEAKKAIRKILGLP